MNKELAAIVRFELASRAVKAATKAIGDALSKCPASSLEPDDNCWPIRDAGGVPQTHIWHALNVKDLCDDGYRRRLGEAERYDHISDSGCLHCLQAFDLIEKRRVARSELGISKRALRAIGRSAINNQVNP